MITLSTIPNSSCSRHGNNGNERKREGGAGVRFDYHGREVVFSRGSFALT